MAREDEGRPRQTILYSNGLTTPIGQIALIASIENGRGIVPALPLRVYGSYAIVYITRGEGRYQDTNGAAIALRPGALIFVFPELAHSYAPLPGRTWDELYIVFRRPLFDAARTAGILNSKIPVRQLGPVAAWSARLQDLAMPAPATAGKRAIHVTHLLTLLTEIAADEAGGNEEGGEQHFLAQACHLLSQDLSEDLAMSVFARRAGLSYESFRKRFQAGVGISPAQFRAQRRMETACDLLQYTSLTNAQIAEALGFSDEYHFSKRFKQLRGQTPSQFRRLFLPGRSPQ